MRIQLTKLVYLFIIIHTFLAKIFYAPSQRHDAVIKMKTDKLTYVEEPYFGFTNIESLTLEEKFKLNGQF